MSGSIESRDALASAAASAATDALPYHYESSREIAAPAEALFAHLDDHKRLFLDRALPVA